MKKTKIKLDKVIIVSKGKEPKLVFVKDASGRVRTYETR